MRRGAKPAKVKVEAKPRIARKARKSERSGVHELEKQLAEAQKREAEALEQQTATAEILRVISNSPSDVEPVFDAIVRSAVRLCDGVFSIVLRFDGEIIHFGAQHNFSPDALAAYHRWFPRRATDDRLVGRALLERRVINVPDVTSELRFVPGQQEQGFRSVLFVPMVRGGVSIGVIGVSRMVVGPFPENQVDLLKTFADQAVIAIENVRLFKELEARNRDLTESLERETATGEILRVISGSPTDVQPVFDTILDSATRLCAAENGILFRYDGGAFHTVASRGLSPEAEAAFRAQPPRPGPQSGLGRMLAERRPVHIADVTDDIAHRQGDPLRARTVTLLGARTAMWLPLLKTGAVVGAMAIYRHDVRPFTAKQIELVSTFADQAVIAIENVRMFKELEARNRDLTEALDQQTATGEILRVISSSPTDLQPVFDAIVLSAVRLCEAERGTLYRFDGELVHIAAQTGYAPDAVARFQAGFPTPPTREYPPGRAIVDRTVVHAVDLASAGFVAMGILELRNGSTLAVPLLRDGSPIGAIGIARLETRPYTDSQIVLMQTFAGQAVIAIENVRLFKELEARNRDLTETLEQQTATSEILRAIANSPTDLHPVLDAVAERAARLCGANDAVIYSVDGDVRRRVAHFGSVPFTVAADVRLSPGSVTGRAILERRTVHIHDIFEEFERGEYAEARQRQRELTLRTLLVTPLLREDVVIGAITIRRTEVRPFTDKQIELLKTFADQAVIAIENVRLFTELQEKNRALAEAHDQVSQALDQQTATSEVLRTIAHTQTDVQPVFDTIVRSAARLCHAVMASVLLTDGRMLYLPANYGSSPEALSAVRARFPRPLDRETASGAAILTRSVVHVPDVQEPSVIEFTRQAGKVLGYRSLVTVPMLREGEVVGALNVCRREPGRFSDAEVALLKTFADQAVIAVENVRLFTELQGKNRELTTALDQQTATSEILRAISRSLTDVQPVFNTVVQSGLRLLGGYSATMMLLRDDDRLDLVAYTSTTAEADASLVYAFPLPLRRIPAGERAVHERRAHAVEDIESAPDATDVMRETGRARGWRSNLFVPMIRDDVAVGLISITRREPGPFAADQIALLETFGAQAVIAIENVRLFTELQASNRDLTEALARQTATAEVLRVISRSQTNLQPVFAAILDCAVRLCAADLGGICRVEDGQLVLMEFNPSTPEAWAVMRETYPRPADTTSLTGRAAVERRVIHVPDVGDPAAPVSLTRVTKGLGGRSHLSVPILHSGEPIGVLSVQRRTAGPFSDSQIELVQTFADQAVIAIENARLLSELEARTGQLSHSVEQLTALGEVGRAVGSTLDLETVLTTIVARAVELSGLDGGVVFEYDEGTEEFAQRAAAETGGVLAQARRGTRYRKGEGVLGRTAVTLEPAQVPDITVPGAYDSRVRQNLIESGVRAILAVPMVHEGRLIGCLGVTRNRPGDFPVETHRAAAHLRDAIGPGHPECPALSRDRGQEPAAGGGEPAQVRVPRQHVARAAHPAQRHHRVLGDPGREDVRRRQREADRIPPGHPGVGTASPLLDQRHPRSLEDRGGAHGAGAVGVRPAERHRQRPDPGARAGEPARDQAGEHHRRAARDDRRRRAKGEAGPPEPAIQRLEVHARGGPD